MRLPHRRRPASAGDRAPARRPAGTGRGSRPGRRPHLRRRRRRTPQPAVPAPRRPIRRPGRLTGRAAVLGLALCAVLLTLAYPMRQYLTQRQQITSLEARQSAQRRQVAALEQRQQEWKDPAYVKTQARKRLQFVMPGEIGYVVLDPGPRASSPGVTVAPRRSTRHAAWYSQLWGTVRAADSPR